MFGLSFGGSSEKTSNKSKLFKDEKTDQTKRGTSNETSTGTTANTSTGSSTSTGTSNTNQTTNQSVTNTGTQQTQQTNQSLSDPILQGLDSGIMRLIGQVFDPNAGDRAMLGAGLSQMGNFDVDSFVEGTLRSAQQKEGTQLGAAIRGLFSSIGGTGDENSMSALMGEQMRLDSADRMAGIVSSARAQGQEIVRGNAETAISGMNASTQGLAGLINAIKGGRATATGATTDAATQATTGTVAGSTNTTEAQTQQQQELSVQMQEVRNVIEELLRGQTITNATEDSKGKNSKKGGGFSLSI